MGDIGGDRCDCCGKTTEDLGIASTTLDCCKRCGLVYYCGVECQRKQWLAGHKLACRKPGQIEIGDSMRLVTASRTDPTLVDDRNSGTITGFAAVRVIGGPDSDHPDQWKVEQQQFPHPVFLYADAESLIRTKPAM